MFMEKALVRTRSEYSKVRVSTESCVSCGLLPTKIRIPPDDVALFVCFRRVGGNSRGLPLVRTSQSREKSVALGVSGRLH